MGKLANSFTMMKFLVMFCLFISLFNEMEAKPVEGTLGSDLLQAMDDEERQGASNEDEDSNEEDEEDEDEDEEDEEAEDDDDDDDPNICCYSNSYGEYFWTCTEGCNGDVKPLSQCQGRDDCNECGGITCSSMPADCTSEGGDDDDKKEDEDETEDEKEEKDAKDRS